MTNQNGVTAPEAEQPVHTPPPEPQEPVLSSYSLDYWAEMTERQIERLRARVRELEDEAAPLRMQIGALSQALRTTMGEGPRLGRPPKGAPPQPASVARRAYNHRGLDLTQADRELIDSMVRQGKTTPEVRAALPDVKPGQVYSALQSTQRLMVKERLAAEQRP